MKCPVCNFNYSRPFIKDERGYLIVSCNNCKHVYLDFEPLPDHVSSVYSDDYFKGREDGYPDYIQLEPLLIRRGHYYSKIIGQFTGPGNMLDVGCGSGFIMKGFKDDGWEVKGIEPNINMAKYAKDKFDFDISETAFEQYQDQRTFDLITMIQVFAHFYDVRKCLKKASQFLKPNGLLLIETWNKNSLTAKVMGDAWHEYSPPSVTNWFTPPSLNMLVEQYNFKNLISKRTFKKIQLKHAKSLLSSKSEKSFIIRIIAKIVKFFPNETELIYPADDLFYMVFRKTS